MVRAQIVEQHDMIAKTSVEYPDMVRQMLMRGCAATCCPRASTSRSTSTRRTARGSNASRSVPDGDLFKAIKTGKVVVVTDKIVRFTKTGIELASGDTLEADVVITATGFDLSVMGDVSFAVDGEPVDFADTVTYRGIMFTGVPNLAYVFGYFRSSWTLRADLISEMFCRLLTHMDEHGSTMVTPELRPDEVGMELVPWVEPENFNPGYLTRSLHLMPRQGLEDPWRLRHDYTAEKEILPTADFDDGTLSSNKTQARAAARTGRRRSPPSAGRGRPAARRSARADGRDGRTRRAERRRVRPLQTSARACGATRRRPRRRPSSTPSSSARRSAAAPASCSTSSAMTVSMNAAVSGSTTLRSHCNKSSATPSPR